MASPGERREEACENGGAPLPRTCCFHLQCEMSGTRQRAARLACARRPAQASAAGISPCFFSPVFAGSCHKRELAHFKFPPIKFTPLLGVQYGAHSSSTHFFFVVLSVALLKFKKKRQPPAAVDACRGLTKPV